MRYHSVCAWKKYAQMPLPPILVASFFSWIIILRQYIRIYSIHFSYSPPFNYLSLERVFSFWKFTAEIMEVMQSLPLTTEPIEAIKMVSRFWKSAERLKNYENLKMVNLLPIFYKHRGGSRGSRGGGQVLPPKIGKKYDFFGVKSWFFTRSTPKIFAPPSARRNFFKCAPL